MAVLCSDFTGSGLTEPGPVLIQGDANVPEGVASPQDLPEYWSVLLERNPELADETADSGHRQSMDWYYWRLPIYLTPRHVLKLTPAAFGGSWQPSAPVGHEMDEQIADALDRYPTAVLGGRNPNGYPHLARATASRATQDGVLTVRPVQEFASEAGQASLLWHRHDGQSGAMLALPVTGLIEPANPAWSFTPLRTPASLDDVSFEQWIGDGRTRSHAYLERHGLTTPSIDWDVLGRPGVV